MVSGSWHDSTRYSIKSSTELGIKMRDGKSGSNPDIKESPGIARRRHRIHQFASHLDEGDLDARPGGIETRRSRFEPGFPGAKDSASQPERMHVLCCMSSGQVGGVEHELLSRAWYQKPRILQDFTVYYIFS